MSKRNEISVRDVLVSENIVGRPMDVLRSRFSVDFEPDLWRSPLDLLDRIGRYRALIVRNQTKVDRELIDAGRRLEIVARAGVGLDNVDTAAASDAGIVVAYAPEQSTVAVAEFTIGLMLALVRCIPEACASTKSGKWERQRFTGGELQGRTLGILGLGRIGRQTAVRACAFGMRILACDQVVDRASSASLECAARMVGFEQLLAEADVVSCHVPETAETIGLMDYRAMCRMKSTAFLVNTSRGRVVREDDLVRALHEGRIAGAALDVRESEPAAHGPLCTIPNVILTPHIAAMTHDAQERVVDSVCADVAAVLRGEEARGFYNFSTSARQNGVYAKER